MQTRVITLRFNSLTDGFDDAPLRDFTRDKEVISVRDHFFVRNEQPYLVVVVNYTLKPMATEAVAKSAQEPKRREESWRHYVAEADVPLFNALREWRLERSKRDGVPPYVICTNRQFAAIVATRAQTLSKLGEVEGFGQAKLERYGADVLAVLGRQPPAEQSFSPNPTETDSITSAEPNIPMNKKNNDDLPIFIVWMEFLEWLMPTTAKFPRKIRHTFAERIEALALDVCEDLVEARYTSTQGGKPALLKRINLKLEKMRVLLRLSHKLEYLSHNAYEHATRSINDAGQQLGSWIKQQQG